VSPHLNGGNEMTVVTLTETLVEGMGKMGRNLIVIILYTKVFIL